MASPDILSRRIYINPSNQVEFVELVEDPKNPDGVYLQQQFDQDGNRLPDIPKQVKLRPTGVISKSEPTLKDANLVMEIWSDYLPLPKD